MKTKNRKIPGYTDKVIHKKKKLTFRQWILKLLKREDKQK